jgi:hypothetical protein
VRLAASEKEGNRTQSRKGQPGHTSASCHEKGEDRDCEVGDESELTFNVEQRVEIRAIGSHVIENNLRAKLCELLLQMQYISWKVKKGRESKESEVIFCRW